LWNYKREETYGAERFDPSELDDLPISFITASRLTRAAAIDFVACKTEDPLDSMLRQIGTLSDGTRWKLFGITGNK
jgi:hypothetical protein